MRQKSHDLQYLEVLYQRGGLTVEEEKEYWKLLKGYQGEIQFDQMCHYFLSSEPTVMEDITLQLGKSVTQIDQLIAEGTVLWIIDIKNYQGKYKYENNCWTINGSILSNNICEQLSRACRITQQILNQEGIKMTVKGVLVFINPHSEVKIVDSINELVLSSNQIPQWLMSLKKPRHSVAWQSAIENYRIPNYRTTRITTAEHFAKLKKGIRCPNCGSFATKKQHYHTLECSCGCFRVKEKAILRTISEYGIIRHDVSLKKKDIHEFIGKEYGLAYLETLLKKHFKRIGDTYCYENKGVSFDIWFDDKKEYLDSIESRIFWNRKD